MTDQKNKFTEFEVVAETVRFNVERLIPQVMRKDKEAANLFDEMIEGRESRTEHDLIDAYCDATVFAIGALWKMNISVVDSVSASMNYLPGVNMVSKAIVAFLKADTPDDDARALKEVIGLCRSAIEQKGYSFTLAMRECLLEIHDRTGYYNVDEGKWLKMPPKPNAYKADYSKAKIA